MVSQLHIEPPHCCAAGTQNPSKISGTLTWQRSQSGPVVPADNASRTLVVVVTPQGLLDRKRSVIWLIVFCPVQPPALADSSYMKFPLTNTRIPDTTNMDRCGFPNTEKSWYHCDRIMLYAIHACITGIAAQRQRRTGCPQADNAQSCAMFW